MGPSTAPKAALAAGIAAAVTLTLVTATGTSATPQARRAPTATITTRHLAGSTQTVTTTRSQAKVVTTVSTPDVLGRVTRYDDAGGDSPQGIVAGPDGALWYTNGGTKPGLDSLGRISTTGTITHFLSTVASKSKAITAGPDGALWFTQEDGVGLAGGIGRMTTTGTATLYQGAHVCKPDGLTVGPDNAIWFTSNEGCGSDVPSIGRLTTAGVLTTFQLPNELAPFGIATGSDGALWFTNFYAGNITGSISRITTDGTLTTYTNASLTRPTSIVAGPGGDLWFINKSFSSPGSIGRVTTTGAFTFYSDPLIRTVGGGWSATAGALTVGPDDALWFNDSGGGTAAGATVIGRLEKGGDVTTFDWTNSLHSNEIATGPDGNIWFTASDSVLGRVTAGPPPPTNLNATGGNANASVTWNAPVLHDGANVTSYTVTSSPGAKTCTVSSPTLTCTVTGLTNGTPYTFTAKATNGAVASDASAASNTVTPLGPPPVKPDPPTGVVASPRASGAAASWNAPAGDGGAAVTSYTASASPGGASCVSSAAARACTISGLTNGNTYTVTVTATNSAGISDASTPSAAVVPAALPVRTSGPYMTGNWQVGRTLTCIATYTGASSVSYGWLRGGTPIAGAHANKYKTTVSDYTHMISCRSWATNQSGSIAPVSTVSAYIRAGVALHATSRPTWKGTAKVGKTVKASSRGTWSPTATSYRCQWLRNGKAIKGATKCGGYTLKAADKGKKISVKVTAKRYGYANGTAKSRGRTIN